MFELFNLFHYFYLMIILFLFIFLNKYFLSINLVKRNNILFLMSLFNLIIHFLKVLLYPYNQVTTQIYYLSLSNLCAINVILCPFVLKVNNKTLNNFFMIFGFISGLVAIIYPYELVNFNAFNLESIRYFVTHFILLFVSYYLYKEKKINYRYLFVSYFIFLFEQTLILLNDFIFFNMGIIPKIDYSNGSLIYGISNKFDSINSLIDLFVLDIFKTEGGYIYLLWQIIPSLILFILIFIIVTIFFDNSRFKNDCYKIKYFIIKIFNKKYFDKNSL